MKAVRRALREIATLKASGLLFAYLAGILPSGSWSRSH